MDDRRILRNYNQDERVVILNMNVAQHDAVQSDMQMIRFQS